MCIYLPEDLRRLNHCMYRTFLKEPRLHVKDATGKCGASRNTVAKYWKVGLEKEKFFPPQLRLNMYKNRKEYIYLIQSDSAHKLYTYFQNQPDVIYISYTSGKFDLFLQTSKPLDVLPDRTVLHGSRGDYIIPNLTNCTYENALDKMEAMLESEQEPSKIPVEYPDEPPEKGSSYYGWMIYPNIKYNLRTGFTPITRKLHISFASFYKGIDYLLNISTVLLPYYPLGFRLYSQYFLVFWSNYEKFLCELFSCLPCHTSITKVDDALVVYTSTQNGEFLSERLFRLCFGMIDTGLVDRFWSSKPVYYWRPNPL